MAERSPNWGGSRQGAGAPKKKVTMKIADLQALAANLQSLVNIAEVKAPSLCDDPQWIGICAHINESMSNLGIDEWTEKTGEKYRQAIEND